MPDRIMYSSESRVSEWLTDALTRSETAADHIRPIDIGGDVTQTISTLVADDRRWRGRAGQAVLEDKHQMAYLDEWALLTRRYIDKGVPAALASLADLGFAWRDIARLLGVSVPAIQKWRKGGPAAPENRRRLAEFLGACDLIRRHRSIEDIGQWFEVQLSADVPLTPLDLWAAGQHVLAFEYALGHRTVDSILDEFDPEWRAKFESEYETFLAGDGQLSIRLRDR